MNPHHSVVSGPMVSVIIPAYNCENFLSQAIDSVLQQTYENVELIVVDDGSRDNTATVAGKYENRLKYIHQQNGGVSKARNTGLRHATGEYVAFLDSDDVWDKMKLECQIHALEKNKDIDWIFCDFKYTKKGNVLPGRIYESGFNIFKEYKYKIIDFFDHKTYISVSEENVYVYWGNIYKYLFKGNFILPSSVLFRKKMVDEVGYLNEDYRVAEETEYFLRCSRNHIAGFIHHPLLCYEIPESGNLSGKSNTEKLMKNALKTQIDSFAKNNLYFTERNQSEYMEAISVTYCRLAYFYLSEMRLTDARKYSGFGLKACNKNMKLYFIYFMSMLPEFVIRGMANMYKNIFSYRP